MTAVTSDKDNDRDGYVVMALQSVSEHNQR
jgi:hypothetical protein